MPPKRHILDLGSIARSINDRFAGAVILRPGSRGTGKHLVRNQITGRVLPCHYGPCWNDGDTRYHILVPMENPGWRDPQTGREQMYEFIFCSELCRRTYCTGTPYEKYL